MNPTKFDYALIETYVCEANRMRSEAVGEMLTAAWRGIKRAVSFVVRRPTYPSKTRS